ncbi:non-ribosomal peptide synthetase [Rhodovibrionaceae bacterium A322]
MIPFSEEELCGSVGSRFRRVAAAQPEALALVQAERTWTYREFEAAALTYARAFAVLASDRPVALVFRQGAEAQISLMGAFLAGVTAVPIDPQAPPGAFADWLAECQMIVTDAEHVAFCQDLAPSIPVIESAAGLADLPAASDLPQITGDRPALIYLTSGTTGLSKGVIRTHRAICHQTQQLPDDLRYEPEDRQALFFSFSFAGSMPAISGAYLVGGAISLFDLRRQSPGQLIEQLEAQAVTVLHLTPSILRELAALLQSTDSRWQPRLLVVSGEKLYPADLRLLTETLGWDCAVVNRLATSETAVIADWRVDLQLVEPDEVVPVGYPIDQRDVTLLDEEGAVVEDGDIGEVVVTGDFMSLGYWRRPDLTEKRFEAAPTGDSPLRQRFFTGDLGLRQENGLLAYFGRKDNVAKVRGFQVDLGEVEQALLQIEGVLSAAVKIWQDRRGSDFLLGYVHMLAQQQTPGVAIREALLKHLPEFMVPRQIRVLESMPLTSGGKLNYADLPAWNRQRPHGLPDQEAPQGAQEELLAKIWSEVLEIDQIGRRDDFFDLGGDSLMLVSVAAALKNELPIQIEETDLFGATDLAGMASLLPDHGSAD